MATATKRKLSFEQACAQFPHRYTLEHKPNWARNQLRDNGAPYMPQYSTDREWYDNTDFPGEGDVKPRSNHCMSHNPSWPMGKGEPLAPFT